MENFCSSTPPCAGYCTAGRCNGCPGESPGEVSFGALHFCARTEPFAPVCAEKFTFASPCVARALCFGHTSGPCEQTSSATLAALRAQYESALLTKLVRIRRQAVGATALCGASHEVREYFVRRSERAAMAACAAGLAAVNTAVEALAAKTIR